MSGMTSPFEAHRSADQEGSAFHPTAPSDETHFRARRRLEHSLERYRRSHHELVWAFLAKCEESLQWQDRYHRLDGSPTVRLVHRFVRVAGSLAPAETLRGRLARRVLREVRQGRIVPEESDFRSSAVPAIPNALQPEVSIVIPAHDQWQTTARCLTSIATTPAAVGYEVIVVDDASSDETRRALGEIAGITVIPLDTNVGFVHATNAGIAAAKGRFVVLLNNDTLVQPGWLDALVDLAEMDPTIGVIGAKLVYPSGRLQEAGGIIYRDGSGHNYGRDQDPNDVRFNFVRDVDYCSGACLLVRHEVLRALGGLDQRFAPAYYEDTDLCFAARSLGYRVVYQPASVVVHVEGVSHGTNTKAGIKRYQEINCAKFVEKWASDLDGQWPSDHRFARTASWRTRSGRVVVVDHQLPMPDHDSGSVRMKELLLLLRDLGFAVTFAPYKAITVLTYRDELQREGIEVLGGPGELDIYLQDIGTALRLAVLSRPTVAWALLPMFRSLVPEAILVYDTVDLHFLREERRAGVEEGPDAGHSAAFHRDMELALARLVDAVWVVSDVERERLLAETPDVDVAVVPNVHRPQPGGPGFDSRAGILFVGSYPHAPNRDAAAWLATEILPRLHELVPGVRLTLAGSDPTEGIQALANPWVEVTGWVPDLVDLYHGSRVFAAPLRFGAGMKGKIGESLSFGLPVVTTKVGAEGLHVVDGRDLLLADDPDEFAGKLAEAYTDQALWESLASAGRQAMDRQLSPPMVKERLRSILSALGILKD